MRQGFFMMNREIFDDELFNEKPFCKRGFVSYLYEIAAYKPHYRNFGGTDIWLEKGDIAISLRKLSEQIGWKKDATARALKALEKRDIISIKSATPVTVITIRFLSDFKGVINEECDSDETESATVTRQHHQKNETQHNKVLKQERNNKTKTHVNVDEKKSKFGEEVRAVFEHWVKVMGKDPKRAKLNPKRRRLAEARLKEGYDVKMLMLAIDGLSKTDWNMGRHKNNQKRYDDFQYFCKDGERVETMAERGAGLEETENDYYQHRAEKGAAYIANALNFNEVKNEENRRISENVLPTLARDGECDGENSNR